MLLTLPVWGEAEVAKGLQYNIEDFRKRRSGGCRSNHITLLVDDERFPKRMAAPWV